MPTLRGAKNPTDEWEENESVIYQTLSQYQKDGYHAALQIAGHMERRAYL